MSEKPKWPEGPYILATSNSWRRFLTESGRSVCEPTVHPRDKHPDLVLAPGVGDLFRAAPALAEALEQYVTFHSGHVLPPKLVKTQAEARRALALARGEEVRYGE